MAELLARLREALADRYTIERKIGQGGMAAVYLAHDLRHDRRVALKVLDPELTSAIGAERFLREIRMTGQLTHPHILPMYDSDTAGGLLFYTMPFVDGESLRDRLTRDGRFSLETTLLIASQIADGLAYAHAQGIVHRDMKPENALLSGNHVWVADFGLARALNTAASQELTASGFSVGSPRYVSPEQAADDAVDGRSDIYSLACVIYEMLAGEPPFTGDSVRALIARHISVPAPSITDTRPEIPERVSAAIRKAMSKDPSERFQHVSDFLRALDPSAPRHHYKRVIPLPVRARLKRNLSRLLLILGVAALLGGGAAAVARRFGDSGTARVAVSGRRIIVTPFDNRTGSAQFEHLGSMAADWITSGLQRVRAVEVVPTPTALQAFRFVRDSASSRAGRNPASELALETGANIVVTGAVYRRADRLLFRLQITDVGTRKLVETLEDVEAPVSDPIAGVEEVRERLMGWFAAQYDERIRVEMSQGASPPVYRAYVAFTEGLDQYIANDYRTALPHFLEAYKIDSSFSASLLYASICLSNLRELARSDSLLKIIGRSRLTLSEYDRAWLDYREAFLAGKHEAALKAIRAAAELAPHSKSSYNYAVASFETGRPLDALRILNAIPPERGPMRGFLPYWFLLTSAQHAIGRYDHEHDSGLTERRIYSGRLVAFVPILRSFAAQGRLDTLDVVLRDAEKFPSDPSGMSYGEILIESADELRAHGYREASAKLLQKADAWYRKSGGSVTTRWARAKIAYALGRYQVADSLVSPLLARSPGDVGYLGIKGLILSRMGDRVRARAVSDSLIRVGNVYQHGAATLYRARIAAVLGDRGEAMARLRQAFGEGLPYGLWYHRDPDLAPLQGYDVFSDPARPRS